jgi:hypothetical protein
MTWAGTPMLLSHLLEHYLPRSRRLIGEQSRAPSGEDVRRIDFEELWRQGSDGFGSALSRVH